jgi:hypothetical protein
MEGKTLGNLGYVRFENTYKDLMSCSDHLFDDGLSESEEKYRLLLVKLCKGIVEDWEIDSPDWKTE